MRKTLLIILAVFSALFFASCSGTGETREDVPSSTQSAVSDIAPSSEQSDAPEDAAPSSRMDSAPAASSLPQSSQKPSDEKKQLSAGYADILKSGNYLLRYKISLTEKGEKAEAEVTIAADGKTVGTVMKADGLSTHTLYKGNTLYWIDDAGKTYFKMSAGQKTQQTGNLADTEDLKYVGSGTGKVNGRTLPYEEYSTGGSRLRLFLDGGKLYAITSADKSSEAVMTVLELSDKAPAELVSIPASYKQSAGMPVPDIINPADADQADEENP